MSKFCVIKPLREWTDEDQEKASKKLSMRKNGGKKTGCLSDRFFCEPRGDEGTNEETNLHTLQSMESREKITGGDDLTPKEKLS